MTRYEMTVEVTLTMESTLSEDNYAQIFEHQLLQLAQIKGLDYQVKDVVIEPDDKKIDPEPDIEADDADKCKNQEEMKFWTPIRSELNSNSFDPGRHYSIDEEYYDFDLMDRDY